MEGGTLSYMPPEALKSVNYTPSKASDVYRYQDRNNRVLHMGNCSCSDHCKHSQSVFFNLSICGSLKINS